MRDRLWVERRNPISSMGLRTLTEVHLRKRDLGHAFDLFRNYSSLRGVEH